jgi:hypothetical protein
LPRFTERGLKRKTLAGTHDRRRGSLRDLALWERPAATQRALLIADALLRSVSDNPVFEGRNCRQPTRVDPNQTAARRIRLCMLATMRKSKRCGHDRTQRAPSHLARAPVLAAPIPNVRQGTMEEARYWIALFNEGGLEAGVERQIARCSRPDLAWSRYEESVALYPNRIVMLCDRATVLARSDRPPARRVA